MDTIPRSSMNILIKDVRSIQQQPPQCTESLFTEKIVTQDGLSSMILDRERIATAIEGGYDVSLFMNDTQTLFLHFSRDPCGEKNSNIPVQWSMSCKSLGGPVVCGGEHGPIDKHAAMGQVHRLCEKIQTYKDSHLSWDVPPHLHNLMHGQSALITGTESALLDLLEIGILSQMIGLQVSLRHDPNSTTDPTIKHRFGLLIEIPLIPALDSDHNVPSPFRDCIYLPLLEGISTKMISPRAAPCPEPRTFHLQMRSTTLPYLGQGEFTTLGYTPDRARITLYNYISSMSLRVS